MTTSQFSDDSSATHPSDNQPYDAHSTAAAPAAPEPVDWPPTEEIRDLLRCDNSNCTCHRPNGSVHCPAHDDSTASLSVDDAPNAKEDSVQSLWFCHGGCSQDAVTKALYKLVFEGAAATNAATFTNGGAAPNACNAAPKSVKTLRQRGINAQTRRHFGIESHRGSGLRYPVRDSNGNELYHRIKSAVPGQSRYMNLKEREVPNLAIYNMAIVNDSVQMKRGLYIVKSEFEVWVMYQCGFAAVSFLGADQDFDLLVQVLMHRSIFSITALFGNDLAGRQSAIGLFEVAEKRHLKVKIALLDGPLGFDLGDLFCQVGLNPRRFGDEIDQLDFAGHAMREAWRQNPEVDLPEAAPETSTSGTVGDVGTANIGADGLFRCLDEADLQALPLPECVVEGVVLEGRPTIFYGLFGTGKSLIALDMALSVSQNMPWCGRETKPGMAFFVAGEGANGLKKRVAAWKKYHSVKNTPLFRVIPHPIILSDPAQCRSLIKTIKDQTQATGTPAALIVIDTLALSLSNAGDENSAGEMTLFLKAAESICLATGAAVLILHHPNRQGDARGSTALPSNSDGFLALEGKTSSEVVKLNPSKVRDMGENGGIKLRRVVITLEDMLDSKGKPVTSAVFVPVSKGEEGEDDIPESESPKQAKSSAKSNFGGKTTEPGSQLSEKVQATWQALLTLNANGAAGVSSGEWAAKAKELGVSGATFERAKKKLQDLDKVEREDSGKTGPRFTPRL